MKKLCKRLNLKRIMILFFRKISHNDIIETSNWQYLGLESRKAPRQQEKRILMNTIWIKSHQFIDIVCVYLYYAVGWNGPFFVYTLFSNLHWDTRLPPNHTHTPFRMKI